ncbi:MAG: P-loop ATPase, Sll1717 family [Solirubrobacteraceae bacterium]
MKAEKRQQLLADLRAATGAGAAETDLFNEPMRFLPVIEHLRILEPTARLIVGAKGSGKSGLFLQLTNPSAAHRLAQLADGQRIRVTPVERTDWVIGFSIKGQLFPSSDTLGRRIKSMGRDFRSAWLAMLVRSLLSQELALPVPPEAVRSIAEKAGSDVVEPVRLLEDDDLQVAVNTWLDDVERELVRSDRWLFVVYDDLDVLSPDDWQAVHSGIGELIRLWATTSRRYERLQPKLFLRSDVHRRIAVGPDIGKLALGGVDLRWSPGEIYALVAKRMVNQSDALRTYLAPAKVQLDSDPVFGFVPRNRTEAGYRGFAERLIGEFMGAGPRKGYTYRWIPNHLQDGNGLLFPRPAVQLFNGAAEQERGHVAATGETLLHHSSLRAALDTVSHARVRELTEHEHAEFPWMATLVEAFKKRRYEVPMTRREFEGALKGVEWKESARPPTEDFTELAEHLEELGIARRRRDGRFDIGDLYLAGFGLLRKGGVARPR